MNTLITSIEGIRALERELAKCPTVEERHEVMERIRSNAVRSSFRTMVYFILAVILAGVIRVVL